jgi:hypothetical protein
MAVTSIDPDVVYWEIVNRLKANKDKRVRQPVVRLHDGDWISRGRANHVYDATFTEIENETGTAKIEIPPEHYLARWITNVEERDTKNVHVSVEKDGVRWTGRMWNFELESRSDGKDILRVYFRHDYEEFKHILVWANPFLPAEIQFPKLWLLFGSTKWCLKTTLFCNLWRIEGSLWSIPDDLMNPDEWLADLNPLNQSTWSIVVKPDDPDEVDNTPLAVLHSRFKDFHTVSKDLCEDAQITPTFRRYFDGDEPPWEGANLRHGTLVVDFEDKSDFTVGTSFGGSIFTGLIHALVNISSDGMTEGVDIMDDPAWPDEYYESGFKGTFASAPGIIYRHGEHTGISESLFMHSPAKDVRHVIGGHSMPGVNELISAAIQMAGDLIAMAIGVPPVGGMIDAVLKPLYTDVFMAFMHWSDYGRGRDLGNSHYHERWAEGADRSYTLSAIIALRTSIWATRQTDTHKLTVVDGLPWTVGQRGHGHFYLGDRIGSTIRGGPKGRIYVDRVSEITLSWNRTTSPTWTITIGQRKWEDPVIKALEKIRELFGIARDLGVL